MEWFFLLFCISTVCCSTKKVPSRHPGKQPLVINCTDKQIKAVDDLIERQDILKKALVWQYVQGVSMVVVGTFVWMEYRFPTPGGEDPRLYERITFAGKALALKGLYNVTLGSIATWNIYRKNEQALYEARESSKRFVFKEYLKKD
jgi:hypothetical protein